MLKLFRNSLVAGFIVLLPLSVTLFILNFLISKMGRPINDLFLNPIILELKPNLASHPIFNIFLDIIATIIILIVIGIVGFLSKFILAKVTIRFFEKFIEKIPVAKQIYKTSKQIVDTFSKQKKAVFQEVVLVEFPKKSNYAIGFLTSSAKGEIQHKTGTEVLNIFVPTTPNPTSGFLIMFPKNDVIRLDMTIPDAMKLIISGGAVSPEWIQQEAIEKIEQ